MPAEFIIGTSVLIQLITVLLALRLIKVTGGVGAWIFISAALAIMEGRRVVSLFESVVHHHYTPDSSFELLGLLTSLLMLTGVILISPLFKTLRQSEERQKELIHKLETTLAERREAELLLQENRHFIERIIDTTPNLLYIYDLIEQRNVFANREVSAFLGYSQDEVKKLGPDFLPSILHPDDIGRIKEHHKEFAAAKDTDIFEIEYRVKDPHGQWRWLHSREVLFSRSPDGLSKEMLGIAEDITEHKNAEEALRRAYGELEIRVYERTAELSETNTALEEEKNRIKITNSLLKLFVQKISRKEYLDAVVNVLQQWIDCRCLGIRILHENGTMPYESYAGYSQAFLDAEKLLSVGTDQCACIRMITENTAPPDLSSMTEYGSFYCNDIPRYLQGLTETEQSRFRGVCVRNGFGSVALIPIRYQEKALGAIHLADEKKGMVPSGKVLFAETLAPIIGESIYKFNAEENLKKSQDQLRNLTVHLQEVRENERTIVAREIHDELGQIMTALKMDLSWIKDKYQDHTVLNEKTKAMLSLIDATIQTVKKIITDLRPGILDHLGISAAIEWQAGEFQKKTGIPCDVDIMPEEINLNKDLTTNLFRIFQEILTNIMRHAEATHISVFLAEADRSVVLSVKDNGKGVTEEQIFRPSSFGIMGIRERVNYMGGSFTIAGVPRKGTEITVIIPLEDYVNTH